jgi:hypothetical protein
LIRFDARVEKGDDKSALANIDRLVQLVPRSAGPYTMRAVLALLILHDRHRALADLDRALEVDPRATFCDALRSYLRAAQAQYLPAFRDMTLCARTLSLGEAAQIWCGLAERRGLALRFADERDDRRSGARRGSWSPDVGSECTAWAIQRLVTAGRVRGPVVAPPVVLEVQRGALPRSRPAGALELMLPPADFKPDTRGGSAVVVVPPSLTAPPPEYRPWPYLSTDCDQAIGPPLAPHAAGQAGDGDGSRRSPTRLDEDSRQQYSALRRRGVSFFRPSARIDKNDFRGAMADMDRIVQLDPEHAGPYTYRADVSLGLMSAPASGLGKASS